MADTFSRPLRVFLCHSSGDKPIVRELYRRLDAEGWIDVWLDEEKLYPGQDWHYEIIKALDNSDAVIVSLSTSSVSKEGYVQKELRFVLDIALEKPEGTIYILPVRLNECERPLRLRHIHGIDYFPPEQSERAYTRLLRSLELRARHLNLLINEPKDSPPTTSVSPVKPTTAVSEPVETDQPASPKPTPSVVHPSAAAKRNPVWIYGRLIVILLLITGFFGPWFRITSCAQADSPPPEPTIVTGAEKYSDFISSLSWETIIPLVVGALFLLTLARLIPWKHRDDNRFVRTERLVSGVAPLTMFFEMIYAFFTIGIFSLNFLWGFWISMVGNYLAPINILFESRFTRQKGQKMPRWAWLIFISIILPWLLLLLLWIWLIIGQNSS